MARLLVPKLGVSVAHFFPWARTSSHTAAGGVLTPRALLLEALNRLNDKLAKAGERLKLWMIGGGVMMFALDARDSTLDLDVALKAGKESVLNRLSAEVRQDMAKDGKEIPDDWINQDFSMQLGEINISAKDFKADPRFQWSNLKIEFASVELMLALKAFSLREGTRDLEDLKFLMKRVNLKSLDHLYDILERYQDIEFLQDGDDILIENMAREVLGKPLIKS
jgi:hypothetical protein